MRAKLRAPDELTEEDRARERPPAQDHLDRGGDGGVSALPGERLLGRRGGFEQGRRFGEAPAREPYPFRSPPRHRDVEGPHQVAKPPLQEKDVEEIASLLEALR